MRKSWKVLLTSGLMLSIAQLAGAQNGANGTTLVAELGSATHNVAPRPSAKFVRSASVATEFLVDATSATPAATLIQPRAKGPAPWYAPLASLAVPGAGQAMLKQQRLFAYLAAEGFLVLRAVRAQSDRNAAKLQYQKLAADVARSGFGTDRPAGDWDYYEILEHYQSSGNYDLNVGGKFTPEPDVNTYNGNIWYGARLIFWDNPDTAPLEYSAQYTNAIARYKTLAVQGSYRFSWKDQANVHNEYILSIADANRSRQQAVSTIGLLAANHLASAVDAYINVRLRRYGGAGLVGATIKTEVRPTGSSLDRSYGAAMTLSVPVNVGSRSR